MTVAMPTFPSGHEPSPEEFGVLLPLAAIKSVTETVNNSAALQNDDELFVSVLANATYEVWCQVFYVSGTTPDIKFGWTGPAAATFTWASIDAFNGSWVDQSISGSVAIGTSGSNESAIFAGLLKVGANAGTLQLQWAQNGANASNTQVLANSYLVARRIA